MTTGGSLTALVAPTSAGSGTPTFAGGKTGKFGRVFHAAKGGKGQPTLTRARKGAKRAPTPKGPAVSGTKTTTAVLLSIPLMTGGKSPNSAGPEKPLAAPHGLGPSPRSPDPKIILAPGVRETAAGQASRVPEGTKKTSSPHDRTSGQNQSPDPASSVVGTDAALTSRLTGGGSAKPALRGHGLPPTLPRIGAGMRPKADPTGHQAPTPLLSGAVAPKPGAHLAPGVATAAGGSAHPATPPIEAVTATQIGPTWRVQALAQSGNQVRLQVKPPASAPLKVEVTLAPQSDRTRVALTVPTLAWQHPLVQDSHLLQARLESQNLPNPQVTVSLGMGNGSGSGQGSAGSGTRGSPLWMAPMRELVAAATVSEAVSGLDFRA